MCSILLIFLLFVIVFDFAHDCAVYFDIEEKSAQGWRQSPTWLVSASHWGAAFGCEDTQKGTQGTQPPSFQRSLLFAEDSQRYDGHGRCVSMALWHMPQIEQEGAHNVPKLPCSLELWHQASHRAEDGAGLPILCVQGLVGDMGSRLEEMGEGSRVACSTATFSLQAKNQKSTKSKGQRQAIRGQRKRWKEHWRFLCRCISLWPTCTICPAVANNRDCDFQFSLPDSQYIDPVCTGRCCYGRGPQRSLPRRGLEASECEGHDREGRERCGERCRQRTSLRYQGAQQGAEDACRESRCQATTQSTMGQACQRGDPDLARPVAELSQTADGLPRNYQQSQAGHRDGQEYDPAFECQGSQHRSGHNHTLGAKNGSRRAIRHRQRRGKVEAIYAKSVAELCTVFRPRSWKSADGGSARDQVRRRDTDTPCFQASKIIRALSSTCGLIYGIVNFGGADPVLCNGMHGALFNAGLAGDSLDTGTYLLSDCDAYQLMPWSHSIWDEPNFLHPFDAVLRAQSLSLSLYKEETECKLGLLQAFSESPLGSHDLTDFASDHLNDCQFFSKCHPPLKSCFLSRCRKETSVKRCICFRDSIDLYVGIDQEITMQHTSIEVDAFLQWTAKPWRLRPTQIDALEPEVDPLSSWAVLISGGKDLSLDTGTFSPIQARLTDEHDSIPSRVAQASREPVQANGPVERHFQPPAFVTDLFSLPGFPCTSTEFPVWKWNYHTNMVLAPWTLP